MGGVLPVVVGILTLCVFVLVALVVGLIRHVDDLDRRLALVGMAMPGRVGRLGLKVGSVAPEIQGRTLDGDRLASSDWSGTEYIVLFAHPGCPPCEELVPDLISCVREGSLPPTIIVSEGTPESHPEGWKTPSTSQRVVEIVLQDRSSLGKRFETFVTPHMFVIADDGRIAEQGVATTVDEIRVLLKKAHRKHSTMNATASISERK